MFIFFFCLQTTQNIKFYWFVMKIKKFLLPIWWYNRGLFPLRNKYFGVFVLNGIIRRGGVQKIICAHSHHKREAQSPLQPGSWQGQILNFYFWGATFHIPVTKSATLNKLLHCSLWQFSGALKKKLRALFLHFGGKIAQSPPPPPPPPCIFFPGPSPGSSRNLHALSHAIWALF